MKDRWEKHKITHRMYLVPEKKYYYGDSKRHCISQALGAYPDLGKNYHDRLAEIEKPEIDWAIDKGNDWEPDWYRFRMFLVHEQKYFYGDSKEDCVMKATRFFSAKRGSSNFYLSHYNIEFYAEKEWSINRGNGWEPDTYRYCMYLIADQMKYFGDTKYVCLYKAAAGGTRSDNIDYYEKMAEIEMEKKSGS